METSYQDNITLIKHLKKGNKKAYSYLVDNFNLKLCVYANSLINDRDIAKDIVQIVFIKIWERRNMLNENLSLIGFLYKSVYNEFIDHYRKQQSLILLEKSYVGTLNKLIEQKEESSTKKLIKLVMIAINDLPPKCKQTFLLSKKEGLTNIEIAEYLNISIKSVEAHITKAYFNIRDKVGNKINTILFLLFKSELHK